MLDNLSFSRFKAYFRVEEPIRLPGYVRRGSSLRGALGYALRAVRYGMTGACPECMVRSECRYQSRSLCAYFFDSPSDHPFLRVAHEHLHRRMQREVYPQPFIIDPIDEGDYGPGALLVLPFTLIGRAIEFFPFMACALSLMGRLKLGQRTGNAFLEAITDGFATDDGNETLIFDGQTGRLVGPCQVVDFDVVRETCVSAQIGDSVVRRVLIRFVTPFRYKHENRLGVAADLTFEIFLKKLLERFTFLSVHSPLTYEWARHELLHLARQIETRPLSLEWCEFERLSARQKERMRLGGVLGDIEFVGNLDVFLPFLQMGAYLNVGKAASFGFGRYLITELA